MSGNEGEEQDATQQEQEFKEIGERILLLRQEEEDINDELLAELLIKKLSCLFPNSSKRKVVEKYSTLLEEKENQKQI